MLIDKKHPGINYGNKSMQPINAVSAERKIQKVNVAGVDFVSLTFEAKALFKGNNSYQLIKLLMWSVLIARRLGGTKGSWTIKTGCH